MVMSSRNSAKQVMLPPVTLRKKQVRLMRAYERQKMAVMMAATTSMLPINKTHCESAKVNNAARRGSSPTCEPLAKYLKIGKRSGKRNNAIR